MNFKNRSYKKELLDNAGIPFEDIRKNMEEIDQINRRLGGHRVSLIGLQKLLSNNLSSGGKEKFSVSKQTPLQVCEIGCGSGGNMKAIAEWATRKGIAIRITGIDINGECIRAAKEKHRDDRFHFITSDYREVHFETSPDIIFNSLFCHHFTDEELTGLFRWLEQNSRIGFFVNDLHRHFFAYYSIKLLTGIFSGSYLVRNDAPLSVLRGFKKDELVNILDKAGIRYYSLTWHWAFRWLLIKNNL